MMTITKKMYLNNTLGEAPVAETGRDGVGRASETVAHGVKEPLATCGGGIMG